MHEDFQITWLQLHEHWRIYRRDDGESVGCVEDDGTRFIASAVVGEKLERVAYGASVHEVGMALVAYHLLNVKIPERQPVPDNIRSFQGAK